MAERYLDRPPGLLTISEVIHLFGYLPHQRNAVDNLLRRAGVRPTEYRHPRDNRLRYYRMSDLQPLLDKRMGRE